MSGFLDFWFLQAYLAVKLAHQSVPWCTEHWWPQSLKVCWQTKACPLKPRGLSRLLSPCFLWISQQLINMFHAQCALLLVYLCTTDSLTFRFLPACRPSGTIPKWAHEAKEYWTTEHVIHMYNICMSWYSLLGAQSIVGWCWRQISIS